MGFDNIMTYFTRCDLPKYDMVRSAEAYLLHNALGCPICGMRPCIKTKSECAGHGEYFEYVYIRCNNCRLDMLVYVPLAENFFDELEKTIFKWNGGVL